jgi:hypothetical protein
MKLISGKSKDGRYPRRERPERKALPVLRRRIGFGKGELVIAEFNQVIVSLDYLKFDQF